MQNIIIKDYVKFADDFEKFLENDYPSMSFDERANASRKLLNFLMSHDD